MALRVSVKWSVIWRDLKNEMSGCKLTSHQMETVSALLALCAGIHRWPVNSPLKGKWRGALLFYLIYSWINGWVNNREAGDLRRHRAHYGVIVMAPWRIYALVNKAITGSDNSFPDVQHQAIIETNSDPLLIRLFGTNLREILIKLQQYSYRKIILKISTENGGQNEHSSGHFKRVLWLKLR